MGTLVKVRSSLGELIAIEKLVWHHARLAGAAVLRLPVLTTRMLRVCRSM